MVLRWQRRGRVGRRRNKFDLKSLRGNSEAFLFGLHNRWGRQGLQWCAGANIAVTMKAARRRLISSLILLLVGASAEAITTLSSYKGPYPTGSGWTMAVPLWVLDSANPALADQVLLHYDQKGSFQGETLLPFALDDSPSLLYVQPDGASWWSVRCRVGEGPYYPIREGTRSSEDCRRWVHRAADGQRELARLEPPRLGGHRTYLPSVGLCSVTKMPARSPSRLRVDCFEPDRPIVLSSPPSRLARFRTRLLVDIPSDELRRASSDSWAFGPGAAVFFVGPHERRSMKVHGFSRVDSSSNLAVSYELTLPRLGFQARADRPTEAKPAIGDPWVKSVSEAGKFLIAGWGVDHDGELHQSAVAFDRSGEVLSFLPLPSRAHGGVWFNEEAFVVSHFNGAVVKKLDGPRTDVAFPPPKWQRRLAEIEQQILDLTEADPPSRWIELALAGNGERRYEILGWIAGAWPDLTERIPAPLWPELTPLLCRAHGEAARVAVLEQFLDSPIDWRRDWTWSVLQCFDTPPKPLLDALRDWWKFDPRRMDAPVQDAEERWGLPSLRQ